MVDVYISGLGLLTPLGAGRETFWTALAAGTSGVGPVTRFSTDWLPTHIAVEIPDFRALGNVPDEEADALDPAGLLALSSARAALADAGLLTPAGRAVREDIDLVIGTTHGDLNAHVQRSRETWEQNDKARALEMTRHILRDSVSYAFLFTTAQKLGITGYQSTNTNACAASGYALTLGLERLRQGKADIALCGGVDVLAEPDYTGFCSLRALAPEKCQPFDVRRRGLVMGEAGALLVLETGESLRRRGGKAWAKFAGYGWSSDGYHLSTPHPEGLGTIRALRHALRDAGLAPEAVDCIIAHGTGTPGNDRTEAQAFKAVFGERLPPVTAPKSMLGHGMGAASAVEAAIGILAVVNQAIPPTINHTQTDPACPIEVVSPKARAATINACLTNSSGFGGNNDSLIFTRPEPEVTRHD